MLMSTRIGLRVYGTVPALLERVVPSRTSSPVAKSDEEFDMMGYALPPGTLVATQGWSMHRDADIFPSPDTFLPERWLSADGSQAEDERLMRYLHVVLSRSRCRFLIHYCVQNVATLHAFWPWHTGMWRAKLGSDDAQDCSCLDCPQLQRLCQLC